MKEIPCPSCGAAVQVPGTKTGTKVGIGCLVAAGLALPIIAVVGLLAAIAIPSFVKARETAQTNSCINNMRMIDAAKEQVVIANQLDETSAISDAQISQYLPMPLEQMTCVAGGTYTVNPLGVEPECSVHGSLSGDHSTRAYP